MENSRVKRICKQYGKWRKDAILDQAAGHDTEKALQCMQLYGSGIMNHLPDIPWHQRSQLIAELEASSNPELAEDDRILAAERAVDLLKISLTSDRQ